MICDLAITSSISWSIYPVSAIVFSWLVVLPLFHFGRHKWAISLAVFSVLAIPLLNIILSTAGFAEFFTLIALPTALITLPFLWIIFWLLVYTKMRKWYVAAICMVLVMPVDILISMVLKEPFLDVLDIMGCLISAFVAIIFWMLGNHSKQKN